MSSISQTIRFPKKHKLCKQKTKLRNNPQKRAISIRVLTISPKKPNSANRRIVKANILHFNVKLAAKIPGESHSLQQHSMILIRGARIRDLIGVSYSTIRGKYDLNGVSNRKTSRSLYGVKKLR